MTRLPQGWATIPIGEASGIGGLSTDGDWIESKDQDPSGSVRLIQLQDIGDGAFVNKSLRFLTEEKAEELNCTFLFPGDVLIARMPDPLGRACRFPDIGQKSVTAVDVHVWRKGEFGVDPNFLVYCVNSPGIRQALQAQASGTTRQRVSGGRLKAQEIPLPPLPEQRRIVRKLDILSARTTTARTHLTAIEKLVERYKLAVLSRTLFRDEMPVKRLGDVLTDIRYGTAAKCSYDPTGTPVLRIPNIQAGRIDRSDLKTAHFAKKEIEQLALRAGDILVIRSNGSPDLVGRVALVTERETDCLFAGYLIRLRLSATEALPEYVRLCFESDEVRAIIEAASKSTSGVNNVNSTQLKEIELPLPAVDEQREIVHRIKTAFARIDRLATEAAKALKLLGHLDQRILAKAFVGELVPQDPTDEPAEALLASIREARAATPKARRGRKARA